MSEWAAALAALAAAYGSYRQTEQANEIQQQNAGPQQTSNRSWIDQGPIADYNWHGLNSALSLFQQPNAGRIRAQRVGPQISGNSQQLSDAATQFALGDNPLLNAGNDFTQSLLAGNSPNQWMSNTYDWAENGPLAQLFGASMAGMGGAGGGAGGGFSGAGGSWSDMGPGRTGDYLYDQMRQYLDDPYANPIYTELAEMGQRQATEAGQQALRDAGLASIGSGRFGGGAHNAMAGNAMQEMSQGMGDANTAALMALLGVGQNFAGMSNTNEMNLQGINASGRMNAANNAAANSRFGADLGLQQQLGMGNLALQAALGQGGFMSGIGSDMLGAQMGALGNLNTLQGLPLANMQGAFGISNQLDQQRQQAAQANANRQMQAQRHNSQRPWENLFNYGRAVDMFGSPFYTMNQQGMQPGQPFMPADPWLTALQGGVGTYSTIRNMQKKNPSGGDP